MASNASAYWERPSSDSHLAWVEIITESMVCARASAESLTPYAVSVWIGFRQQVRVGGWITLANNTYGSASTPLLTTIHPPMVILYTFSL